MYIYIYTGYNIRCILIIDVYLVSYYHPLPVSGNATPTHKPIRYIKFLIYRIQCGHAPKLAILYRDKYVKPGVR